MKRSVSWLLPLLVGALSLGTTAWLWNHDRLTDERNLRTTFDFGVRQTATRIEERMASYEQMLRGVRGLFEASDAVTRADFSSYVESLLAGSSFAGLRMIAYAPLLESGHAGVELAVHRAAGGPADAPGTERLREDIALLTYAAPVLDPLLPAPGRDISADPLIRDAMNQARDSGEIAITRRMHSGAAEGGQVGDGFVLFLPLYAKGQPRDTIAARRASGVGWVFATFRIGDLMSSLYGEGAPGLDVRIHEGVEVSDATRLYPLAKAPPPASEARFQALEYVGFAGHDWTVSVRSGPQFAAHYNNDSPQVIAIAGAGLSLALALLAWQLVTARERANDAARAMTRQLREGSERYRRIVDTAGEGIWMVDADARTSFVNPKLQQMLGYGADELLERRWLDFTDDAGRAAIVAATAGAAPGSEAAEPADVCFRRKDGSDVWATLSTSPITDAEGRPAGTLAMVSDVTERRLAQENRAHLEGQLRESQKMEAIGTLAGGIAHDFNNILAAILGNVALIRQDLESGHASGVRLEQIRQAGERGRSLVQQIVAFSRREQQQRIVQPLRPLLVEAATMLRSTLSTRVELELRLSDEPLFVSADATQLQQVLMNLCTNAWHAMADGAGRVIIGLDAAKLDAEQAGRHGWTAGRYAHVWVADNGCGMDVATQARIFEPFFTTKPVGKGTGLGLAVVHGIVTSHGGVLGVASAPGLGTTFDMYFPLSSPAEERVPVASKPSPDVTASAGRGQHVLYVDDDPVMGVMVEGLLQRAGYRVTTVAGPREALACTHAPDAAVDIVVTDFNMPEMSGLDLTRELKLFRPRMPVILTSGYITDAVRADALAAGVSHVLQKEYTFEQLATIVQAALDGRNAG